MALVVGQCTVNPVTGMAGRIFTRLQTTGASILGMQASAFTEGSDARNALAGLIEAIAKGVVDEIAANGKARVVAGTIAPLVPTSDVLEPLE